MSEAALVAKYPKADPADPAEIERLAQIMSEMPPTPEISEKLRSEIEAAGRIFKSALTQRRENPDRENRLQRAIAEIKNISDRAPPGESEEERIARHELYSETVKNRAPPVYGEMPSRILGDAEAFYLGRCLQDSQREYLEYQVRENKFDNPLGPLALVFKQEPKSFERDEEMINREIPFTKWSKMNAQARIDSEYSENGPPDGGHQPNKIKETGMEIPTTKKEITRMDGLKESLKRLVQELTAINESLDQSLNRILGPVEGLIDDDTRKPPAVSDLGQAENLIDDGNRVLVKLSNHCIRISEI